MWSESGLYGLDHFFLQIYTGSRVTRLSWEMSYIVKKFPQAYLFEGLRAIIIWKFPLLLVHQRENIYLSIMLSICFVSFSFRFCTFKQERSTTGSCFELLTSWNISGVFIGTLEKLFRMLCMFGSWPISSFTALTQEHRTLRGGWKGEGSIARNGNSERYEMKYWVFLWAAFF